MFDYSLGGVFTKLVRTLPFIVFRFIIYFLVAMAYTVLTGIGGAVGLLVGQTNQATFFGGCAGFVVAGVLFYWLREYILYLAKAGHIAVLVELHDGRELPGGRGQIDYAAKMVKERFLQSSVLFGLDQLIKGILRTANAVLFSIASIIPIPGLDSLMGIVKRILNMSLTYVDEIIIAQIFRTRSENPWDTGRHAIILYAQNYKVMIKNAVSLTLIVYVLTFVIFLLVLGPVSLVLSVFPPAVRYFTFFLAVIVAWCIKAALLEPIAVTALMEVYFKTIEGQEPNPEWDEKLSNASNKFRDLKDKAFGHGAAKPAPETA